MADRLEFTIVRLRAVGAALALCLTCAACEPTDAIPVTWQLPDGGENQGALDGSGEDAAVSLLSRGDTYDDFPSIVSDRSKTLYTAYAAHDDGRDRVRLHRRLIDSEWSLPVDMPLIEGDADIWMPQLAVDGRNKLWVIWSENTGRSESDAGNWDLHARALGPGGWESAIRLTRNPKPDINHRVTTDSEGRIYVAWQAHPENNGDIWLCEFDGKSWSEPLVITAGPGSDWFPDVAVDADGVVWIAFDSYRNGDYDVFLVSVRGRTVGPLIPVATSPYFEGYASVASGADGRIWVAWERRGPRWGKDVGFGLPEGKPRGSLLGGTKGIEIVVAALEEGRIFQAPPIASSLPREAVAFLQHAEPGGGS